MVAPTLKAALHAHDEALAEAGDPHDRLRDLWHVITRLDDEEAREVSTHYAERTGRPVQPALLARYRLAWALPDVAGFTAAPRAAAETADTATARNALVGALEELGARHTSLGEGPFVGQEVTSRTSPAGP